MSLEGAKLICLNDVASDQNEVISAQGRTFKFGYYMDCDVVLEHPDAMGLQCTIDCDAFGRVTIENRCPDQTVTLNGEILKKMRPLLNNTEICIFDKKFLWQFEGNPTSGGFQMEDIDDFITPCKQTKKAEQPPNSEPARRWRTQFNKRLTIHSFAYCIKANESPKDVEITTDENKPLNTYERIIPVDLVAPHPAPTTVKRLSASPPPIAADLIDLKTPKARQKSLACQRTPLSCCKLSETVITSYSPRETGVRPEKSFALVQSPAQTSAKSTAISDVSLGTFQHLPSPLTVSHRPSMHLIDLTTPKKRVLPFSPAKTLLKSTLKKNIPTTSAKLQRRSIAETITTSMESVYSVPSTDEESVIELSDEGNLSPSPVPKTPRRKTPQSLMKHAIISSAKKAEITKRLNLAGKQNSQRLMFTPPGAGGVRFQSQSTPQRKSLGRLQSPSDSQKATQSVAGKIVKSMFTSTPFRAGESATSKRSILRTPSTSLTGVKNKSRTSLMLKHALSKSPQTSSAKKRKSVSFLEATKSLAVRERKSVSFLDRIEREGNQSLNRTFSIEEENSELPKKDATFSPEKEKLPSSQDPNGSKEARLSLPTIIITDEKVCSSLPKTESAYVIEVPATDKAAISTETNSECLISHSAVVEPRIDSAAARPADTTNAHELSASQTPQSSRDRPKETKTELAPIEKLRPNMDVMEDDDFEGLDTIFKTPKAKNLMILGSPKSISLQKLTSDSVELIHSTEFDLSANLDDIFKTPQSEFIVNRVEEEATPANVENMEPYSPEEAFDLLVGRPITRKTYANKTTPPKQDVQPLNVPRDNSLPKTDIEEWIDNVNNSIQILEEDDDYDDLTATQNEFSRDPLLTSSVSGSVSTTNKKKRSPKDESAMTIQEELDNTSTLKDPLEMTAVSGSKKSPSPNISGIDLLDHTSESLFSETLEVSDESSGKESDKTIEQVDDDCRDDANNAGGNINISPDKARLEIEEAFKNFEKERKMLEVNRLVSTPEPAKPVAGVNRRKTMGSQQTLHAYFDVKLLKEERDMETAFENFKKGPTTGEPRLCKTPDVKRAVRSEWRKTMGNPVGGEFDVNAIKAEREMELAFENFIEKPGYVKDRAVQTPDPAKVHVNDHRRRMGSAFMTEITLDLKAVKAERDTEVAFENFEEKPQYSKERCAQTPEPKKTAMKDHRRTMGSNLVTEVTLDLEAAKAQLEMDQAFENFEDEPEFSQERAAQTPEPKKTAVKDHRRTMGSNLVTEVTLDLQAAKSELEMEQAFENFEDEPEFSQERTAQTPKPKKAAMKDHRRTLGSKLVTEVTLDLDAAKAELEMEQAFANFDDEPEFSQERAAQTPEPKKTAMKDHRRTLGSKLVTEVTLDLDAAKAELEMEQAFANFDDEPEFSQERAAQTPEPKKTAMKDHRRTMGSNLITEVTLDLQAAKAQLEMEQAFENFEDEPEFSQERTAQTPKPKKAAMKDHRRTLGSKLVTEVTLDLDAAKAELEMEQAFANFDDEPEFSQERAAQTPEPKKTAMKDHRRTMGSNLITEVTLDLQAAKAQLEMEQAFENFEDEPEFSQERTAQTPKPKKAAMKDHRRTLGSKLVTEVTLDLDAAKAELEMEQAFANFDDEPEFSQERAAQTPEPKKTAMKDHRITMGSNLITEVTLDLQAAKAQLEMEQAFENFEDEPEFSQERAAQTPEPKKTAMKDHRRTLGSKLVTEVTLDLDAAKAELEMEQAFANFDDEPEFSQERAAQTPEPKKTAMKDHRRTLGSKLVTEVTLDLDAAKAELEMEQAFANFDDEPEFSQERAAQTPEPKKTAMKDHRRTMGSNLVTEVTLDLQAAKSELEMEQAFENFEDEPEFSKERAAQTPEPKKTAMKDHRRTMGSNLVTEVTLDLEAAKAQLEMDQAFENFEDEPEFSQERAAQTPEPKKTAMKDHRRTMGSKLITEVTLDLQAAKSELEMEQAFENFEDEPDFSQERAAQTPEPKKTAMKDHRRTMGSNLVTEVTLDLEAAKAQLETDQAFENFEDEPEFSQERAAQTPEPKKTAMKDHRRTMGSKLVTEVTLDLQAAKSELEMEQAFENFEDEPDFSQERAAQTPEPKKKAMKDHRTTMGSNLVTEVTLDLEAAKAQLVMDQAFENFEDEPEFSQERAAQTPEPKKTAMKDHRRTMGSNLVTEVTLDLEAAKAQLEMDQAFENFEDEPEFSQERAAQTPEPKKTAMKDHRRTMGSNLVTEVTLDLEAAKAELEMEQAFENFEKDPTAERLNATEASALESSIRKENAELVPVMDINCAQDACETNHVVAVSDSDDAKSKLEANQQISKRHREEPATESKPRSIRKRQQSVDEGNKCKEEVITQTPLDEQPSIEPRVRRRRQNTIDEVLEEKSNLATDTDIGTIVPSQPKSRRRRQPTTDDFEQIKQQDETPQMQSGTRRGRLNSVDAGSSLKDQHNHRSNDLTTQQPQTEIEKNTTLKREEGYQSSEADFTTSLSTKVTAITADEEIHKQLEPIAEEDKFIAAQIDDGAAKSEAKPIHLGADQIRENPTSSKSVLNLKAEVDEIASTPHKSSSNRVRGRTAQLSVVLVQSKDKRSPSVHSQHTNEIKMEADVKSETYEEDQNDPTAAGNDADEVIQCTPAPTKTRGRRPAHKVEPAEAAATAPAPALRRGRRGSVQQDVDVKVVEHVVSTTPLQTKLRGRKGLLKGESTDGSSSPAVDLIPPTPETTRPRGRRAAIKVESSKTTPTAENVTPSRNRVGQGADAIHSDGVTEAPAESVTEEENQRRSTDEIHTAAVISTVPLTVQVLPVRKRGRKKANADPEVPTEESDVGVKEKGQMGSVEDADSNKNEVAVPLTAEKSPVRKRGRKKAVADPNLSTDQTDVPPKESSTESITSQRRSDVQSDKVASAPTEPSGEEKRKSLKGTDTQASETSVSSAAPRKRGRRANNADPVSLAVTPETEPLSDKGELIEPEVIAPASKRGRKKAVQDTNTNPDVISVSPTEDMSSPHNIEPITPSALTSEPLKSTTEDSIPVDDFQANAEEVVPTLEPPKKRGRKPKLANSVSDALTLNVSQSTQLPISTRGRRGVLKTESVDTDAESPAPKRVRKRDIDVASTQITAIEITEMVDDSEKVAGLQQDQTGTEETAPSTPVPTKPQRGRRPALKTELIRPASSTPVRGRGQRGADVLAEEPVLPVKIEPTTESATGGRKRGRKAAEKEAPAEKITVDAVKSGPIEPAAQPGRKRGRIIVVQSEIPTEDDDVEKVIPSEQQTQQEASTSELLSKSEPIDNIPAKKRGRPAAVKSQSTPESSTPVRKRGRKAAAKEEVEPTESSADNLDVEEPPSAKPDLPRARRLPAILKESAAESVTPRQRKTRNPAISKCEEESADLDQTPVKPEVASSSRPIRSRRASAKEVVEEKPIAAEEKLPPVSEESEKRPTRGRKAKPKKDVTIDSTASHTEEELPPTPIKTKPTRGRKPTVKADISATNEKSQIEDTNKSKRGRKPNTTETGTPSEDEVEGTPVSTRKTTRNKVAAQIESLNSEGNQPVKKTTRGRKAAASNSDDGPSSPSCTPKNQTRSRKVPQPVAKRAIQQNMEITAEDDQDCTPSKRIRRKPNILLSDEFVH